MPILGAIIGGFIAFLVSIPIFGMKGGRMVKPGVMEFDLAKGDVAPGGCLKMLGNLAFIALGALLGAAVGAAMG